MIHADSVLFLTSTDDRIQKYSSMFAFSWKTNQWILNGILKNNVFSDVA